MLRKNKISHKLTALILVVAFCLFLLPAPAHAAWLECTLNPIDCTLFYTKSFLGYLISYVGSGINTATTMPVTGVEVVVNGWNIVRGFANMFFILALIIMAFGTIFSIQKYDFRTLIARFLIAALLINFSLVIGEIIIDWSTSLSNVFLGAIGNVGDRIAEGANLGKHFADPRTITPDAPGSVDLKGWQEAMRAGLDIVMMSIIFFSLTVLLFFSVIRVPILWALLIISPIAWITYILPTTTGINRQWWKYFMAWNLFMPIYLFFIYFGVLFLGKRGEILPDTTTLTGFSSTFQDIFFYVLIGIFLIGGAKTAISSSMSAGAGGVAGAIWARGRATARFAGSRAGRLAGFGGISAAAKERLDQFKREGFTGTRFEGTPLGLYGGKEGLERSQSKWAERMSVRGAGMEQAQKNIQLSEQKLRKEGASEADLSRILADADASPEQKLAAANIIKGQYRTLRGDEVKSLYEDYKKLSPAEAAKWIRGQKDTIEGLSKTELDEMESIEDPQMKQFIARIKAKRDIISTKDEWQNKLNYFKGNFGNDASMAAFIGESKEFAERLNIDDALELINSIPKENRESIKKYANLIAKKGVDTQTLLSLTGQGGAFESPSEIEKFLDLAKEGNLDGALEAKKSAGVLRDLVTKEITQDVDKVLEQEFSTMSPKVLAARPLRRSDDPAKQMGVAVQRELDALKRSLEKSKPQRLEDFYRSDEYTSNLPLAGFLDPVIQKIRDDGLKRELLTPLEETASMLNVIIPQIMAAKDGGKQDQVDKLTNDAQSSLVKAKRLGKLISDSKVANDTTKDTADRIVVGAESNLKKAKDYKQSQKKTESAESE